MCQHPLDDKNRRELNFNRSAINYQVNHRLKPRSIVCDYHSGRIGIWPPPEKKPREKAG